MTGLSMLLRTVALSTILAGGAAVLASSPPKPVPDADAVPWSAGPYTYDGSGNIQAIGTDQFRYDAYGRLVTSGIAGTSQSFTYDRYGNIVSITTTPTGGTASTISLQPVAARNRLPQNGPDVNATYDASGRVTFIRDMTGTWNASFTYDALDSVVSSSEPMPRVHLYTASDERIATIGIAGSGTAGSDWTLRDPSGKVLRRLARSANGTWTWIEDYVYMNGQLVAAEVPTPERTLHFHRDHLGTPRLITNHMGARVGVHSYYAFGREITPPSQHDERLKYTGHERDSPELDYMHARYYLPGWGRFLSVDPKRRYEATSTPQEWNRYSYAINNPIKYLDPNGLDHTIYLIQAFSPTETPRNTRSLERSLPEGYKLVVVGGAYEKQALAAVTRAEPTDYVILQSHASIRGLVYTAPKQQRLNASQIVEAATDGTPPSGIILSGCDTVAIAASVNEKTGILTIGGNGGIGITAQIEALAMMFEAGLLSGAEPHAATESGNVALEGNECPLSPHGACHGYFVAFTESSGEYTESSERPKP